jgi:hypothetical protein
MTTWQFEAMVNSHMKTHPDQRKGQVMFNLAWHHIGDKINYILDTSRDPFYNDDNIPKFMEYLTENNFFSES